MKILAKLLVGFVAVAMLCAVVGVVGTMQMQRLQGELTTVSFNSIPSLETLYGTQAELLKVKVALRSLSNPNALDHEEFYQRQMQNIEAARAAYHKHFAEYEELPFAEEEAKLYAKLKPLIDIAAKFNNDVLSLVAKAKAAEGEDRTALSLQVFELIDSQRRFEFDDMMTGLTELIDYVEEYYGVELPQKAIESAHTGITLVIGVTSVSFLVAVILGLMLGSSISRSLKGAVRVLGKLAAGDLSDRFTVKTRDEFAQVSGALNQVADALNLLIEEMNHMSHEHDAGDIDVKVDSSKFKGAYQAMADGVNLMVFGHIAVKKKAMACVMEFGKGNFEAPLEKFPGKKAFINDTIEQVRANLKALITDADMLAQAAVEGRLQTRADASKHLGDFRKIVDGVNRTLDLVITPINETTAVLKRLADGDLTQLMTGDYKGDFDILKTALNGSLESVNEILSQVIIAVEQVAEGSGQVSQASQSLSQGATEQASSLEEITSSITEIAGQTRQNTENAIQVNGLAKTAASDAEQGNVQMKDLVSAMSDINTSAEGIKKIVKAIDDISFQINLLALNANVEAARAGKYGKGFAVVAEEVRNLAVRSANSVKETTGMVDEAISNIGRGNELVSVTAKQLASIVDGASKVANLAEEVSTASKEQSLGLEQITTGLTQIDQVTQSNTASSEESASAAEELSSQAQQLRSMLGRFKLRARDNKMSNQDMIAMLRAELAKQQQQQHAGVARQAPAAPARKPGMPERKAQGGKMNPADVISLDDDNFGKF